MKRVIRYLASASLGGLFLIVSLILAHPVEAQSVFEPGQTYLQLKASSASVGTCAEVDDGVNRAVCRSTYNTSASRAEAYAYAFGKTLPPNSQRRSARITMGVTKSFSISDPAGDEADLVGSYVSADIRWIGSLIGVGALGTATYKIEFSVVDLTGGREVGYEKIDERSKSGTHTTISIKGIPAPVPVPGVDLIEVEDARTVMSVPLKRGHTYEIRLLLTASALGGLDSDAEANFFQSNLLVSDPRVQWDNLSVTVGADMLTLITDLQQRVDALEQQVDDLQQQADANTAATASNAEAIADNADAIAANTAAITANADSIIVLRNRLECHVHTRPNPDDYEEYGEIPYTGGPLFAAKCPTQPDPYTRAARAATEQVQGGLHTRTGDAGPAQALNVGDAIPDAYALQANYPNPFNPTTTIAFDLPEAGEVRLTVYDVQGRSVGTVVSGLMAAGRHRVTWDAGHLASGTYLYRLEAGAFVETRRMVLIK